jgi:hypothetical protein
MSDIPDFEQIAANLQAFTANPTPQNRQLVRGVVSPFQSENQTEYSAAADHALSYLDNAYLTVGQIHGGFVQAAGMAGFDPSTLSGGQTPEE